MVLMFLPIIRISQRIYRPVMYLKAGIWTIPARSRIHLQLCLKAVLPYMLNGDKNSTVYSYMLIIRKERPVILTGVLRTRQWHSVSVKAVMSVSQPVEIWPDLHLMAGILMKTSHRSLMAKHTRLMRIRSPRHTTSKQTIQIPLIITVSWRSPRRTPTWLDGMMTEMRALLARIVSGLPRNSTFTRSGIRPWRVLPVSLWNTMRTAVVVVMELLQIPTLT